MKRLITICIAVILSLAFTANLSAVPTTFTLDANGLADGNYPASSPLVIPTPYGDVNFVGEILNDVYDPEFADAGAIGGTFNILDPGPQSAELLFPFDVNSLEFIYGGNYGNIEIKALDKDGGLVDYFYQDDTWKEQPAGPVTLSGTGIRSLYWTDDNQIFTGYAALDNIIVTIIPEPATAVLLGLGALSLLHRKKIVINNQQNIHMKKIK